MDEKIQPGTPFGESNLLVATHSQRWIKVNAPIDENMAEIVEVLNRVEGLERPGVAFFALAPTNCQISSH